MLALQVVATAEIRCSVDFMTGASDLFSASTQESVSMKGQIAFNGASHHKSTDFKSDNSSRLTEGSISTESRDLVSLVIKTFSEKLEGVTAGPLASVGVRGLAAEGYYCHPAISDNSMHIGILAGQQDKLSRVPGVFYIRSAKDMRLRYLSVVCDLNCLQTQPPPSQLESKGFVNTRR